MIESLAEDEEKYATFWKEFGEVLKEGPVEDFSNREALLKLLRFNSTADESKDTLVSLEQYVSRMKAGQDKIYYITADSYRAASNSPHLEIFRNKGIEVLLMHDRVDEWMMSHLQEFDGKPFQSVAKGDLDLGNLEDDSEKEAREEREKSAEDVTRRIAEALGEQVDSVRVSHRLTDSPACLVLSESDMAVHMQTLLKQAGHELGGVKPKLEINPAHPIIERMKGIEQAESFGEWAQLLLDQAWLAEGGQLEDPAGFVKRLNRMIVQS